MKIAFNRKCAEYMQPRHPESPERVLASYNFLKDKYEFIESKICSEENILLVHSKDLINIVKQENFSDSDMISFPGMYQIALLSAGSALQAMNLCLSGENTFSLMRPPGHHAGRDFLGGFCYFNNIAIAVKAAQKYKGIRKVLILDIDNHHGNGTQDIFLGDNSILYISLHQSPLYPGTGKISEKNCLNYPLPLGTDGKTYIETLKKAMEKAKEFGPELVAVSAGFDTYKGDPITDMNLDMDTYRKIGEIIKSLRKPTFAALEGGYSKDLPLCISKFLNGLEK